MEDPIGEYTKAIIGRFEAIENAMQVYQDNIKVYQEVISDLEARIMTLEAIIIRNNLASQEELQKFYDFNRQEIARILKERSCTWRVRE